MTELTLYVMQSGKDPDEKRLLESFGTDILLHVKKVKPGSALPDPDVKDWYMIMYDCEYLGKALAQAIPVFLTHLESDYLVAYKRSGVEGNMKYTNAPRLFQKHVKLSGASLMPEGDLTANTILDGYIFE